MRRKSSYNRWREIDLELFGESTAFQKIHWAKHSYYDLYIKDRVFCHNMSWGLTYGNYRNFHSKLKLDRQYRKIQSKRTSLYQDFIHLKCPL